MAGKPAGAKKRTCGRPSPAPSPATNRLPTAPLVQTGYSGNTSVYALSLRSYPATLRSPEYDFEKIVRRVDKAGRFSFERTLLKLPRCLAGEPVGLREIDDGRWELRYGPLVLGVIDGRGATPKLVRTEPTRSPGTGAPALRRTRATASRRNPHRDTRRGGAATKAPVFGASAWQQRHRGARTCHPGSRSTLLPRVPVAHGGGRGEASR